MGNSKFGKLTKCFNKVRSTLSDTWSSGTSGFKQAYGSGMSEYKRAKSSGILSDGTSAQIGASSAFKNIKNKSWQRQADMAMVGAATVGGAAATADFINPWGLGWGD